MRTRTATADGGEVVEFTAAETTALQAEWDAEDALLPGKIIKAEIARLEQLVTPSRLADAALGDTEWLQANRDLIAVQRLLL
jgi:hypothetical protein